ncbi:piggyBac transposable element-derived protein 4-like, partial [Melanaphis sacchari]|uniref:piggyBac transposable element-derived protein 4-like n=1 Tax=Melanaphis sacchari TaxID=742174 RepID=UPI000DC14EDD
MSHIMSDECILASLDEIIANEESDDEFISDLFGFDDEEEIASNQDIGSVQGDVHKYTVFQQNDAEYKTMSDTEKEIVQSDNEEETEVSFPTHQPKVLVPQKINKDMFTPNFKWKSGTPFQPKVHQFCSAKSGIQKEFELNSNSTILDFFEALVTPFLLGKVAYETNEYFRQNIESNNVMSSRDTSWYDTTSEELYLYISIQMLMVRNKKLEIADYWSTDPLLNSPIFGKTMSRNRFQLLLRYIHFCNNNNQIKNDCLFKIDMVLQDIKNNFRSAMVPFQNLVIDESLVLWKGRLSFKQFIRTKRHRFGVKFFILCDVETDYILDFIIYTGKTTRLVSCDANLGQSGAVVKTLMKRYLNKGHTLYTDNWYTSPILSMYLHKKKTNTCGTVRCNRRGMPPFKKTKFQSGQTESKHTGKMLTIKWMDRREVHMLTTIHKDEQLPIQKHGKIIMKPKCVKEYNENMESVDKTNMLLSSVECVRKTIKCYWKPYTNSSVTNRTNKTNNRKISYQSCNKIKTTKDQPTKLIDRHFPSEVPATQSGRLARRRCQLCKKNNKRTDTRYMCTECD